MKLTQRRKRRRRSLKNNPEKSNVFLRTELSVHGKSCFRIKASDLRSLCMYVFGRS
ncbi:unnamed protein product, partial [Cylicocyclus nassatus]